jgi:hypothetical protein
MAEISLNLCQEGVPVNPSNIDLASFRLLSFFLSDREYQKLKAKNKLKIPDELFSGLRHDQIIHLLIEIAILYRIKDNQLPKEDIYQRARKKRIVGALYEPLGSKKQGLTIREACNKIIHAESINYDIKKLPKLNRGYLYPRIYIYGRRFETDWKAILDIVKFCEYSIIPLQIDVIAKLKIREA